MDGSLARRVAERFLALAPPQRRAFYQKLQQDGLSFASLPIVAQRVEEPSHARQHELSYAQARQWFLWQLAPQSSAYHLPGALLLKGELDEAALRRSFRALIERHEALRTVFRSDGAGRVQQVVLEPTEPHITLLDSSALPAAEREIGVRHAAQQLCEAPFDLSTGPLFRIGLLRLSPQEHVLVVVMHHIVSDGWSMQLIVAEFAAHYRMQVQQRSLQQAPLPVQYTDYVVWQRSWLEAGEQARQLEYWQAQLGAQHPVLQLPTDRPRGVDVQYHANSHSIELPAELVQRLRQHASDQGASLFMVLLAAWQALLYRYTGQSDIRVGVPIANRHRVETEALVGLFVNTQVLRAVIDGRTCLSELLQRSRDAALGAQAHQDLPLEQLVAALQPERSLDHSPLFQVMFNHLREAHAALEQLPGLSLEIYPLGEPAAQFELRLSTTEQRDGTVRASFSYARELFEPSSIERLAQHYLQLVHAMVDHPEQRVAVVQLLSGAERTQLLRWGAGAVREHDQLAIHE